MCDLKCCVHMEDSLRHTCVGAFESEIMRGRCDLFVRAYTCALMRAVGRGKCDWGE